MASRTRLRGHHRAVAVHAVLAVWAVANIAPLLWVILNSFRESRHIMADSFTIPENPSFQNYAHAVEQLNIWRAYGNSLTISVSVALLTSVIAGLAAFGISRYRLRGGTAVMALMYSCLLVPVFATIIPVFSLLLKANLINTLPGLILPITGGSVAFGVVVVLGYMNGIDTQIEEAAFIDGANSFQVCARIVLPMCTPALATVAIFSFLWSYNDLFTQLFILRTEDMWAINRLLNSVTSRYGTDYGLMAASIVLVVVPVLVVYIFLQKHIIRALVTGAVKG